MRVAHHVSRAVSFNFTGDLPADYDPLTIDEVFYLATLGGAQGKNSCNSMDKVWRLQNISTTCKLSSVWHFPMPSAELPIHGQSLIYVNSQCQLLVGGTPSFGH